MSVPKIPSTVLVTTTKTEEETERMLTMPEINYIKHLRENEDLSISEIARKVGKDWKTVKKYADGEIQVLVQKLQNN